MSNNNETRGAIIEAILAVQCRPTNVNFPNESASVQTKELPYMDSFLAAESIDESFTDGGYIKQQLVQVNIYVEKGSDLSKVDEYKDAFQSHFKEGKEFTTLDKKGEVIGGFTVFSPPQILSQEETETAFAVAMTFTFEYYVDG